MLNKLLLSAVLACFAAVPAVAEMAPTNLDMAATQLVARQLVRDLSGEKAERTIHGDKALWISLVVQKPENSNAFLNLEADLKDTDVAAQLRDAHFRVMDPKKKSLAVGLRPTLEIMVLRSSPGAQNGDKGFYVVLADVLQDCRPMGGDLASMTTWIKIGDPIAFSGEDPKDINAIRVSARSCVKAFIDAAQDLKEDQEN